MQSRLTQLSQLNSKPQTSFVLRSEIGKQRERGGDLDLGGRSPGAWVGEGFVVSVSCSMRYNFVLMPNSASGEDVKAGRLWRSHIAQIPSSCHGELGKNDVQQW